MFTGTHPKNLLRTTDDFFTCVLVGFLNIFMMKVCTVKNTATVNITPIVFMIKIEGFRLLLL